MQAWSRRSERPAVTGVESWGRGMGAGGWSGQCWGTEERRGCIGHGRGRCWTLRAEARSTKTAHRVLGDFWGIMELDRESLG